MLPLVLAGLMVAAAVVLAGLAWTVGRRRAAVAGRALAVLLLATAWWGLAYAVELSHDSPRATVLWGDLKYVGIVVVPPAWLVFVLLFTGREHLVTRRLLAALAVEPVLVLGALALPATHDLVRYLPASEADETLPVVATGPLFWVHAAYGYAVVAAALGLFVVTLARSSRAYWRVATLLTAAALLPWVTNVLYNLEVGPFARIDLAPFAFVLSGGVLVWGLLQGRMVPLAPVARAVVLESMADGVLVLDAFGHVVDANPAAARLLGRPRQRVLGASVGDVVPGGGPEVVLSVDGERRLLEARRQPLPDRAGGTAGEIVVLRDVTASRAMEEQLRELLAERTRVADALQNSLLPAHLPEVPGVLTAARYRPAGNGREIGGDFYDLLPLPGGRWAAVLGDVSGKGAEAAAVTAMVRYTVRAIAEERPCPEALVTALNETLLRSSGDERFVTLAYAVLTPVDAGLTVDLSLAGHLRPVLRRADGTAAEVGMPGTALGLLPEVEVHPVGLHLRPGDLLCLFTDGLVEARRRDGEQHGEGRVVELLQGTAGSGVQEVADALEESARRWHGGPLADDLAVLVLEVARTDPLTEHAGATRT